MPNSSDAQNIQLTEPEARDFESDPRTQVALLRWIRRLALSGRSPVVLTAPDKSCLATCSCAGHVHLHGPVIVERSDSLALYREGDSTYLIHGDSIVQLERGGQPCLSFVDEIPEAVYELRETELTPTLLALAEAAEHLLDAGWPAGYYRDGSDILWSSGIGCVYRWDGRTFKRENNPPARARALSNQQVRDLPEAITTAVETLTGSCTTSRGAN